MASEIPGQFSCHLIIIDLSPLAYDFDPGKNIHTEGSVYTKIFSLRYILL